MSTVIKEEDQKLKDLFGRIAQQLSDSVQGYMPGDQYIAQLLISLSAPNLKDCSNRSKIEAALKIASLQLLPSAQHVALIPRKVRDRNGTLIRVDVDVMPQWQGYQSLMCRSDDVRNVRGVLVHRTDNFDYDGTTMSVTEHDYDPFDESRVIRSLQDIRGGFLLIERPDATRLYHMVSAERIRKAMNCAQTKDVWNAWFEQQALKTLFRDGFARRVVKFDPLVECRVTNLTKADDAFLGNDPRIIESPPKKKTLAGMLSEPAADISPDFSIPAERDAETVDASGQTSESTTEAESSDDGDVALIDQYIARFNEADLLHQEKVIELAREALNNQDFGHFMAVVNSSK